MLGIEQPILITGAARSGTSMVAGIIERCGAWGGQTCGPTDANQRGQYENTAIRNGIIKPFLKSLGADPLGQDPLPNLTRVKSAVAGDLKKSVLAIMAAQGLDRDRPWFFKGAKLCLIWTQWAEAFPDARWVLVRRDASDIARSCMRTGFMRKRHTVESWVEWVRYHEDRFLEMTGGGVRHIREVWPCKFIGGDFDEVESVVKWLGLGWRPGAVRRFLDPTLWHYDSSTMEVAK